jgi:hypothetical protein
MSRPSVIGEFDKVEAYTPETSRKPSSLGLTHKATKRAIAKKLLVSVGDGRFYLDRAAVKRSDLRSTTIMIVAFVASLPLLWLML